jgi:hypothetical protein
MKKRINIFYYYLIELTRINKEIKIELKKLTEFESSKKELNEYLRIKAVLYNLIFILFYI